jgi:hypothetical protein
MEDVHEIPATLPPAQPTPPPISAQPANTSRHAENQNEFSPSNIAQLAYEIATPRPHSEIHEEIRQGILKKSLPTERAGLIWKHAIAIGRISPATNETLFNDPYPWASLNTYADNTGPPMLSTPTPAYQLPDASPET